jgi:hypothetical protein
MPDIVSRIKVEAQGADQAAREIRKLKDAYDQVAAAAKGLSPGAIGGGDPFSKATAPNSGVMAGGQSNADVAARETRNRDYQEQANRRQNSNQGYNSGLRPSQVGGVFSTAEAAGAGRGGAALGGAANLAAGALGGGLGIALLALGAGAMGIQKFAESSYGRMENVFGGGISQRLGATYANTQNYMTELGRSGVPIGMVNALMTSASASGAQFTAGTAGQFGLFADVAAGTGVDPGLLGQLLGATQRAGVSMEYGTMAAGAGAFGRGSLGTFFTELNRTIEDAMTSGIKLSQEDLERRSTALSGYVQFGGLSPTGAVALSQTATARAQNAAQLQRPEDIIAFQAIRNLNPNLSITDVLLGMESDTEGTNAAVYQHLKRVAGGNTDLLRMRAQSYLGEGTSMGTAVGWLNTQRALAADETITTAGVRGKIFDEAGNLVDADPARKTVAARQIELLKNVQDASLEITSMLGEFSTWLKGTPISTDATNVMFGGVRRDLIESALKDINNLTVQNVSNLEAEIAEATLTVKDFSSIEARMQIPGGAESMSTIRILRENISLQNQIGDIYKATPAYSSTWTRVQEGGFAPFGPSMGDFNTVLKDILIAVSGQVNKEAVEGLGIWDIKAKSREKSEINAIIDPILRQFYERNLITETDLSAAIRELVTLLSESGIVFTDGGIDIPTVGN